MPWEFPSSLTFSRMNAFFHRVQTIEVKLKLQSSTFKLPQKRLLGLGSSIEPPPRIHGTT